MKLKIKVLDITTTPAQTRQVCSIGMRKLAYIQCYGRAFHVSLPFWCSTGLTVGAGTSGDQDYQLKVMGVSPLTSLTMLPMTIPTM